MIIIEDKNYNPHAHNNIKMVQKGIHKTWNKFLSWRTRYNVLHIESVSWPHLPNNYYRSLKKNSTVRYCAHKKRSFIKQINDDSERLTLKNGSIEIKNG